MKFGIISYILHKEQEGKFYSYAPYIKEMDIWLKSVDKLLITAPKISGAPAAIETSYTEVETDFYQVPALNFTNIGNSIKSLVKMPKVIWGILKVMRKADHIHLRCPGNVSLIGCFLQIFFPKKPKTVKYAGNWDPEAAQPWTYKLQKKILSNTFLSRNIKVLVYGNWPNQSANIVPFFTASFSETEKRKIEDNFSSPYGFMFVGSLVEGKNPKFAIQLVEKLQEKGVEVSLDIFGDGILRKELEEYVKTNKLDAFVTFHGNKKLAELKTEYENCHFLILPSRSEGWPKAVAEAMFFGCIPIATPVSCLPWMLGAPPAPEGGALEKTTVTKRGILLRNRLFNDLQKDRQFEWFQEAAGAVPENVSRTGFSEENKLMSSAEFNLAEIISLLNNPGQLEEMSLAAQEWSQQYTLEKFEKAIQEILGFRLPNSTKGRTTNHTPQLTTDNSQLPAPNSKLTTENPQPTTDIPKPLRILQLIDSLRPGGAEKMAVAYANALSKNYHRSYLCCTRKEGLLKKDIGAEVGYLFLNKKSSLDLSAIWKLKSFLEKERIDIVHAHGTSYFLAGLLELSGVQIKLIWHDHYGNSEFLEKRPLQPLAFFSRYFDGIISVNSDLKEWAVNNLHCPRVTYINNFVAPPSEKFQSEFRLKGEENEFKIICVANFRPQKDHATLLEAFEIFGNQFPSSLHLIGGDPGTTYSENLQKKIAESPVQDHIYLYKEQDDIYKYLMAADLGVLSSRSEGLPLALLEYAMAGLPVVVTKVGQIPEVVQKNGFVVDPEDATALANAICSYHHDKEKMARDANALNRSVSKNYSVDKVIHKVIGFYRQL
ncbi:glycosyltransferase [Salegentibacter sp. F188]|uniref:Glycosyltransferase n=1 Tax=Autumnicola patrickiae TaxID=3075591 RepID=A0ABU3DXZ2_9FLAO|nr:glycosyltransferase [Salegentibacter sp. F188]MDT0688584.1 glycosyltransferase [Salegentibacter sp. F188]